MVALLASLLLQQPQKVVLFDGVGLSQWHMDVPALDKEETMRQPFVVDDGVLISAGEPRGHLITDESFSNYVLTAEYRFPGDPGNCGILVHASKPRRIYDMFPQSIEVQLQSGDAGDFWCIGEEISVPDMIARRGPQEKWGVEPPMNRRIANLTDGSEKPLGEWNTVVIRCLGDMVTVWVNGDLVNHGIGCTAKEGQIAIQSEGARVEFRKIELARIGN